MFRRMASLGRGFVRSRNFAELKEQKKDGYETKCEGDDFKRATPPGQDKQRRYEGTKCGESEASSFPPRFALMAGKMRPGVQVKEEWSAHVVNASRALSHRPNTLPLLYLQCCGHRAVSMELKEVFSKAGDSVFRTYLMLMRACCGCAAAATRTTGGPRGDRDS